MEVWLLISSNLHNMNIQLLKSTCHLFCSVSFSLGRLMVSHD